MTPDPTPPADTPPVEVHTLSMLVTCGPRATARVIHRVPTPDDPGPEYWAVEGPALDTDIDLGIQPFRSTFQTGDEAVTAATQVARYVREHTDARAALREDTAAKLDALRDANQPPVGAT